MKKELQIEVREHYVLYLTQAIKYTLLGGINLKQLDRMRVTIKIEPVIAYNTQVLRHSLDLYNNDQVEKLIPLLG